METTTNTMNLAKAPTGGMTSRVNGEFYKGGKFIPITGEFCGQGSHRIAVARLATINATLTDARITWNEKANCFQLSKTVTLHNGQQAEQVICSAASVRTLEPLIEGTR